MAREKSAQVSASGTPPYVSFATFTTALDYLASRGISSRVNASVFPLMSGTKARYVLVAFRFLGLIDDDGSPKPDLAQLVEERTRAQTLKRVIERSYSGLLSKVDLAKASPAELDAGLRIYNVTGTTHRKAKGFLIRAAQRSGMQVSGHLMKRTRMAGTRSTRRHQAASEVETDAQNNGRTPPASGQVFSRTVRLPQAAGTLTLSGSFDPFGLRGQERELFYRLADLLDEFEKQEGAQQRKTARGGV